MSRRQRPIGVDLFSGVGGMSLGFEQAGFNVVSAFDVELRNVKAYRKNFARCKAVAADLSQISGSEIRRHSGLGNQSIDVVFGGPPCQGFSVGGKRDLSDRRNTLLFEFARLVRELRPKYFVLENVAGLMLSHSAPTLNSFCRRVRLANYQIVTPISVLDAADYGVPQRRRRAFILGHRRNLPPCRYPKKCGIVDETGREHFPNVRDAIIDLPDIERFDELFEVDGLIIQLGRPSCFARIMRGEIRDSRDRSLRRRVIPEVLTGCLRTRHSRRTVRRFQATTPGAAEPVSRYIRLAFDKKAPTIRAGTGLDHGKHTAPRPIHPSKPRCITVREAARLHSFPDWFEFHGTRWHAFRQIGNSVPPLLARAVASEVLSVLESLKG